MSYIEAQQRAFKARTDYLMYQLVFGGMTLAESLHSIELSRKTMLVLRNQITSLARSRLSSAEIEVDELYPQPRPCRREIVDSLIETKRRGAQRAALAERRRQGMGRLSRNPELIA
jgi:hypothetical protein